MKEIVMISGKGGTGKTSLTASLAMCFDKKVLADCDVDAADLNLLLQATDGKTLPFDSGHMASIDAEKCISCGQCMDVCRFEAVVENDGVFSILDPGCEGCGVCRLVCPADAIVWTEATCGTWQLAKTSQGSMVHARLRPGAENSGKLVAMVREQARLQAEKETADWILVDGPPGIGCPVIASVTGSDAVVVVTEPTPSGLHDMERVLGLAKHFGVPAFLVVNKSDLYLDMATNIETLALSLGAQVLGRLPYSPLFTQAQVLGKSVVEAFPESEESLLIQKLAHQLRQELLNK